MIIMDVDEAHRLIGTIFENVRKFIVGKEKELTLILATLVSGGHVLVEGPPGVGKTVLSKTIAQSFGGVFKRIQGNPDILPSDITGFHIHSLDGTARLVKGPIFANIVLFDELNRTPSRSQSALLEALQERHVTIDGITYELPRPFMVIATELPETYGVGTFPLALTLIDRFTLRIPTSFSTPDEEFEILDRIDYIETSNVEAVSTPEKIEELEIFLRKNIYVSKRVRKYIIDLVNYIRSNEDVILGISHRAVISLLKVSRALALIEGRNYVIPDDIKKLFKPVVIHRIITRPSVEVDVEEIIDEALNNVEVPKQ